MRQEISFRDRGNVCSIQRRKQRDTLLGNSYIIRIRDSLLRSDIRSTVARSMLRESPWRISSARGLSKLLLLQLVGAF